MSARDELEGAIRAHHEAGEHHAALERALDGYGRELMGFLYNRLQDEDAAAEVFSQVGENLWKGIEAFSWRSAFRTWMYVIARNAMQRHQEQKAKRGAEVGLSAVSDLVRRHRTSTLVYLRTEAKDRLAELRMTLDPDDQTLLLLRIKRRLSWSDVALVMQGVEAMEDDELRRASARYRQRFQTLKTELQRRAKAAGLLDS